MTPTITLHTHGSYNGREFVNEIVKETLTLWPGQVVVINGVPAILNLMDWWKRVTTVLRCRSKQ